MHNDVDFNFTQCVSLYYAPDLGTFSKVVNAYGNSDWFVDFELQFEIQ